MKVAIVGPYPHPGDEISGGVQRVIDTLLQELVRHMNVTLIVPNSRATVRGEAHGVPVIYLKRTSGPGVLTYWTSDARRVASVIQEIAPDIIHYQGASGVARGIERPGIVTVHGIAHLDLFLTVSDSNLKKMVAPFAAKLMEAVERRYRQRLGNVVVINPYVVSMLPDIKGLSLFAIPNPLDRVFVENPVPTGKRARRIFSAGRIGERKQTARAVSIAARVLAADTGAEAVFYGAPERPSDLDKCRRIAVERGVSDRLCFPGNINAANLRKELDRSSVLLMASRQETAPVAIAEAHARGVAVVAPEAFGIKYMIEPEKNGFFLPEHNFDNQVALLTRALDAKWDRLSIAKKAHETYGPETIAAQTIEAYRAVLRGS
jgi:glycosyltransferase involved in cell wall biosynthesis